MQNFTKIFFIFLLSSIFTLIGNAQNTVIHSYSFERPLTEAGWSSVQVKGNNGLSNGRWNIDSTGLLLESGKTIRATPFDDLGTFAYTNNFSSNNSTQIRLCSPFLNLSGYTNVKVVFYVFKTTSTHTAPKYNDSLYVEYALSDTVFIRIPDAALINAEASSNGWTKYVASLPTQALTSKTKIGLLSVSSQNKIVATRMVIDKISIVSNDKPFMVDFGVLPLSKTIYFTDSIHVSDWTDGLPTSRTWTFPKGSLSSSSNANVSVCFPEAGTVSVKLKTSSGAFTDSISQDITILGRAPFAQYNAKAASGSFYNWDGTRRYVATQGKSLTYDNKTTYKPNQYNWNFGNATPQTSQQASPSVSYPRAGIFQTKYIASNDYGSSVLYDTVYANLGTAHISNFNLQKDTFDLMQNIETSYDYFAGLNSSFKTFGERFVMAAASNAVITGIRIHTDSVRISSANSNETVRISVYSETSGIPGTELTYITKKLSDFSPNSFADIAFDPIDVTGTFYIVFSFPNITPDASNKFNFSVCKPNVAHTNSYFYKSGGTTWQANSSYSTSIAMAVNITFKTLDVNIDTLHIGASAGTGKIIVTNSDGFTKPSETYSWTRITSLPSGSIIDTMRLSFDLNASSDDRYATFTINSGSLSKKIVVAQSGMGKPIVNFMSATKITDTSTLLEGEIENDNGGTISEKGFYYSANPAFIPPTGGTKITDTSANFTKTVNQLNRRTTYYVSAYAKNESGEGYSAVSSFSTVGSVPKMSAPHAEDVTTLSMKVVAQVTDDYSDGIDQSGFLFSETKTAADSLWKKHQVIAEVGKNYSYTLTNLKPKTTYYIKSYAVNKNGTATSPISNLSTLAGIPVINSSVTSITTASSATVSGQVVRDSGGSITEVGFYYSTDQNVDTTQSIKTAGVLNPVDNQYTGTIKGLYPKTTYYVRAYAANEAGKVVSGVTNFTTTAGKPCVEYVETFNILSKQANLKAMITFDSLSTVNERGFYIGADPNLADGSGLKYQDTSDLSDPVFTVKAIGLTKNNNYYVKAFARNENGVTYSSTAHFKTLAKDPDDPDTVVTDVRKSQLNDIVVYPNPAKGVIIIRLGTIKAQQIEIINAIGESVISKDVVGSEREITININKLIPGTYFVRIKIGKEYVIRKFVKLAS